MSATLSAIAAPTMTMIVDGPSGSIPSNRAITAATDTATLAPAMIASPRSLAGAGRTVAALIGCTKQAPLRQRRVPPG